MKYGLIGKGINYSLSPVIWDRLGIKDYGIFDADKSDIAKFLQEKDFEGINVTVPYKITAINFIDELSETAKEINAVNTILKKDGKLIGFNTDYSGFIKAVEFHGIKIKGKRVLILGNGGASKAVKKACETLNAKEISVVSRSGKLNYENVYSKKSNAEIIINATPTGTDKNEERIIDISRFIRLKCVVDLNYFPLKTTLLRDAKKFKIKGFNGLYMLCAQAVLSYGIFTGNTIGDDKIIEIYRSVLNLKRNVVLIGMPGCGKSTVGKILSNDLKVAFYDLDDEYLKTYGKATAEDIENLGENGFRNRETQVVINTANSVRGAIIATGGGAVLKGENQNALDKYGVIVYIKRKIKNLDISGRPLLKNNGVKTLYNERKKIYSDFADFSVKNKNADDTAKKIKEILDENFSY